MIRIYDLRKQKSSVPSRDHLPQRHSDVEKVVASVMRAVRSGGDAAVKRITKKYDGVVLRSFIVPHDDIRSALRTADKKFLNVLQQAVQNIRRYHQQQKRKEWRIAGVYGSDLRQRIVPLDRVGVYVPGGKAAYPSTVLMNVIPALVAGVKEIHLVSPPNSNGTVHSDVLVAAGLLGVTSVYPIGGAQAIAALAYGTQTIPAVDKIVGPGNIFVATAKRMVYGHVGIDSIAGPSEVVILADNSANPEFVAADLLAQAEHDERAVPILITTSSSLAEKVKSEINRMVKTLDRKSIIVVSLKDQGRIYIVPSLQHGIALTNHLAPEHLEIITTRDEEVLRGIRHAGSIFLGNTTPVALGDYFAGPNHVLPTERTARFSSPLSVDDFITRSSVVRYTQKGIDAAAEDVALFADREGLTAHALSLRIRSSKRP
jgi:histidinol dehydrogenase